MNAKIDERPESRFKVGQVVAMTKMKNQPVFRIQAMHYDDGWFYAWNRKNFAAEHMIRELTPEEEGSISP